MCCSRGSAGVALPVLGGFAALAPWWLSQSSLVSDGSSGVVLASWSAQQSGGSSGGGNGGAVEGVVEASGDLTVTAPAGFDPLIGERYWLLSASSVVGRFDVVSAPALDGGKFLTVEHVAAGAGAVAGRAEMNLVVGTMTGDAPEAAAGPIARPSDAVVADVDGDGLLDLVMSVPDAAAPESAPGSVVILFNGGTDVNGDWLGFSSTQVITTGVGVYPSGVDVGELGVGGGVDIVVSNRGPLGDTADDTVTILFGDTPVAGSFRTLGMQEIVVGDAPTDVSLTDLDDDGVLDIGVPILDQASPTSQAKLFFNDGQPGSAPTIDVDPNDIPLVLPNTDRDIGSKPGDLTRFLDGYGALAFANPDDGSVTAVVNDGSDPRDGFVVETTVSVGAGPLELVLEDVNGDGLAEIVTVNGAGTAVSVIENRTRAGGALDLATPVSIDAAAVALSVRPVSGDGGAGVDLSEILEAVGGQPTRTVRVLQTPTSGGRLVVVSASDAGSEALSPNQ